MSKAKKKYSENDVIEAIEAVKNGKTLREAASTYGVPKSTISDRMANPNDKRGRPTALSDKVERDLADWLRFMAAACMPVTRKQFAVALAQSLKTAGEENKFKGGIPSSSWFDRLYFFIKISNKAYSVLGLQVQDTTWVEY
jgi:transposase-like protein